MNPGDLLPGDVLAWRHLGTGHRCETWLAWSPALWCPVVAKFPRPHQVEHPRARRSLQREVAALRGNTHPGLPRLHADGTDATVPHLLVELVDGPALDDELDEHGAMAPLEVALLGVQLLAALRAVHARGLVHVDVKPENVVLRDGAPIVIDFGSAREIGALQPAGMLIGSPGYAAPELEAGEPIAPSMDVYGVGVVLHEALTGEFTFDADLPAAERPEPVAPPSSDVAELALRLLDPDPARRPDLASALHGFGELAAALGTPAWPDFAPAPSALVPG